MLRWCYTDLCSRRRRSLFRLRGSWTHSTALSFVLTNRACPRAIHCSMLSVLVMEWGCQCVLLDFVPGVEDQRDDTALSFDEQHPYDALRISGTASVLFSERASSPKATHSSPLLYLSKRSLWAPCDSLSYLTVWSLVQCTVDGQRWETN